MTLKAQLHNLAALSLEIVLWKVGLAFSIRNRDNTGERVDAALSLALVAAFLWIGVDWVDLRAVPCDAERRVAAVTAVYCVEEVVEASRMSVRVQ